MRPWGMFKIVLALLIALSSAVLVGWLLAPVILPVAPLFDHLPRIPTWAFVLVFYGAIGVAIVPQWLRARRRRGYFVAERDSMPDQEFFAQLGLPPDHQALAVAVRHALSEMAHVPAELLRPGDRLVDLFRLTTHGVHPFEFNMVIGWKLGARIDSKALDRAARTEGVMVETLSDYIRFLARHGEAIKPRRTIEKTCAENEANRSHAVSRE